MIVSAPMSRLLCAALILLTACTPEKPRDERRPPKVASRPVESAPPPQLEPLPAEPRAVEPTLEPPPIMSQWWCLCYRREGAEGPMPVTACRELESQCRKLEQRVAKGNDEIIAGSLMQACRSMTGAHPGDVAGTREQWQPSALPGAWVSEGACLLADAAVPEPAGETGEPTAPGEQADPFALMRSELIGDIALGHSSAEIRHRHGEPKRMGSIDEMEATGAFEQVWTFDGGLSLIMKSTTRSGPQQVGGVIVEAPSTLATRRGIVIGSKRDAVERAYGDVREQDGDDDPGSFTAGSTYGGLHFMFDEQGAVTRMFLGAAAE